MALEIERKFLLKNKAFKSESIRRHYICQGYIEGCSGATVRVRISDKKAYLTIKSHAEGFSRREYEYEVPQNDAQEMLDLLCGAKVSKYRYIVMFAGKKWEVDEFLEENKGLLVAEIELADEAESFEKPSWIGEEVTEDRRYRNSELSRNPYQCWV